jgi:hypothetical protein
MPRPIRAVECAFAVLVGATSLGATCVPNPNERPPGDMGPGTVEIGFAEIETDIKGKCFTTSPGCHSLATTNLFKIGDDLMVNYQVVKKFITAATPEQSPLLQKAIGMGTPPHGGMDALKGASDATYQKWLKWITAGAQFDPNNPVVTYADIEKDMAAGLGSMGCMSGSDSCHGAKATNSLKIGADAAANYQLVKTMFLNLAMPAESPLLKKATNETAHSAQAVFKKTDKIYIKWLGWIMNMAPEK